jgi:hypothetical protein
MLYGVVPWDQHATGDDGRFDIGSAGSVIDGPTGRRRGSDRLLLGLRGVPDSG